MWLGLKAWVRDLLRAPRGCVTASGPCWWKELEHRSNLDDWRFRLRASEPRLILSAACWLEYKRPSANIPVRPVRYVMKTSGFLVSLMVCLFAMAVPAHGEESEAPGTESTDVRHLKLGDGYEVVVRREGVEKRYSGRLVQMTGEWLVLRSVSEGRNEQGVPLLSKAPYYGRLFRNVGIGRVAIDRWVPRDSATIVGRSIADDESQCPLTTQHPTWDEVIRVEYADAGEVVGFSDAPTREGATLHHIEAVGEEVKTPWPVLGQLPVIGGTFTSRHFVLREEERQVALGSVLSVEVPAAEEREEGGQVAFD